MAALGFQALASTSSGFAFTLGRLDGGATLDEVVAHTAALDRATDLPVSVDLENGYGAEPEDAAHAITRVAEAGAVGGSIEDYDPDGRIYELGHAVERVAAAVEAARALDFPFTLTARAENHIRDNPDLEDTIARLQAFEQAGADVLYAPGLRTADDIRAVCEAVSKPVNVLALPSLTRARDRRGGRTAHQRRREPHVGRGQRHGRRGHRDPRHGRPLVALARGCRSASGSGPDRDSYRIQLERKHGPPVGKRASCGHERLSRRPSSPCASRCLRRASSGTRPRSPSTARPTS